MFAIRDFGGTHQQYTDMSQVRTLTIPNNCNAILVQAITQNIRMTLGGEGNPTASLGFRITAGNDAIYITGKAGHQAMFIQETASAVLEYQYVNIFQLIEMKVR